MGLAEFFLGKDNGIAKWAGENSNLLGALGAGLAAGPDFGTGIARGLSLAPQARQADRQMVKDRTAEMEAKERDERMRQWAQRERPDLIPWLDSGVSDGDIFNEVMKKPEVPDQQNPFMSAGDGKFFNWQTGEYTSDPNATAEMDGPTTGMGLPVSLRNKATGEWAPFAQTNDGRLINTLTGQAANATEWDYDPGMVAGTRAEQTTIGKGMGERALEAPMAEVNRERLDAQTDNVISEIDKAIGQVAWDSTGMVGQTMGALAGSKAYDLRATAGTIKANLGFAELQAMRDSSPTGGALGAIAVQELEALQSTLANLDPNQSEPQLKANLEKIKQLLERQKMFRQQSNTVKYEGVTAPPGAPAGNSGNGWTVVGVE